MSDHVYPVGSNASNNNNDDAPNTGARQASNDSRMVSNNRQRARSGRSNELVNQRGQTGATSNGSAGSESGQQRQWGAEARGEGIAEGEAAGRTSSGDGSRDGSRGNASGGEHSSGYHNGYGGRSGSGYDSGYDSGNGASGREGGDEGEVGSSDDSSQFPYYEPLRDRVSRYRRPRSVQGSRGRDTRPENVRHDRPRPSSRSRDPEHGRRSTDNYSARRRPTTPPLPAEFPFANRYIVMTPGGRRRILDTVSNFTYQRDMGNVYYENGQRATRSNDRSRSNVSNTRSNNTHRVHNTSRGRNISVVRNPQTGRNEYRSYRGRSQISNVDRGRNATRGQDARHAAARFDSAYPRANTTANSRHSTNGTRPTRGQDYGRDQDQPRGHLRGGGQYQPRSTGRPRVMFDPRATVYPALQGRSLHTTHESEAIEQRRGSRREDALSTRDRARSEGGYEQSQTGRDAEPGHRSSKWSLKSILKKPTTELARSEETGKLAWVRRRH